MRKNRYIQLCVDCDTTTTLAIVFLCLHLSFGRYSHASMVSIRPVPTKATRRFNWSASTSTSMKPQVSHNWTVKATRVSWWRHQMETFSALLAFCAGKSPVTGEFPAQKPVTRSFDVFFDLRLNRQLSKQWGDAGDLRRYRAHYDVIVMSAYMWMA